MRKNNEETLGSIIKMILRDYGLEEKLLEVKINSLWGQIMGKNINRLTQRIVLKNKVLVVNLRSAPLREELNMMRSKIIGMLNEKIAPQAINDIIFR